MSRTDTIIRTLTVITDFWISESVCSRVVKWHPLLNLVVRFKLEWNKHFIIIYVLFNPTQNIIFWHSNIMFLFHTMQLTHPCLNQCSHVLVFPLVALIYHKVVQIKQFFGNCILMIWKIPEWSFLIHSSAKKNSKVIAASGFDPPIFECLEEIFLEHMSPTRFPYATLQLFLD